MTAANLPVKDNQYLLEPVPQCSICSAGPLQPLFDSEDHVSGERFQLSRCPECGFVMTAPRPALATLGSYYPPEYYGEDGQRFHGPLEKIVHWFRTRLAERIHRKFAAPGTALEVGSGRGTLLAELAKRGWKAFGTEFSEQLADASTNAYGVTVYPTPDLSDCNFNDGSFEVIICYHVLEHLPDPQRTLHEMRRILAPNGLLLVAVPNFGGAVAQLSRGQWFAVDAPRHLGHFSPDTLARALRNAGFDITKEKTLSMEQDVFGFAQSIMNLLGMPYNVFYDMIRNDSARMRHGNGSRTGLFWKLSVFAIGGTLAAVGVPVCAGLSLLGAGGTLEIWARPSALGVRRREQ